MQEITDSFEWNKNANVYDNHFFRDERMDFLLADSS